MHEKSDLYPSKKTFLFTQSANRSSTNTFLVIDSQVNSIVSTNPSLREATTLREHRGKVVWISVRKRFTLLKTHIGHFEISFLQ